MAARMDKNVSGETFTDYHLSDVGAAAFQLEHDWFSQEDLVITTAPGGGGVPLSEGVDYQLSQQNEELSAESGKTIYHLITIINATYQTGDLYFSGKYFGDSNQAYDINVAMGLSLITEDNLLDHLRARAIPFTPIPWNKSFFAWITTPADGDGVVADDAGTAFQLNDADGTDWTTVISAGAIAWNATKNLFATVLHVAAHKCLLDQDAFEIGDVYYLYDEPSLPDNCIELTGELVDGDFAKIADSNTLNHLTDADGTDWTTLDPAPGWALNVDDGKLARVTNVAAHDLTLDWDAFPDGNEIYALYADTIEISDAESLLDGKVITEMNISGRFCRPGRTAHVAQLDAMQEHWHDLWLQSTWCCNTLGGGTTRAGKSGSEGAAVTLPCNTARAVVTDGEHGTPRTAEEMRPRSLSMVMIMRIK